MADAIKLSIEGARATVLIDKAEKRNALTLADLDDLHAALDEAEAAPIRCLVLTGAGDRAFSAGVDLGDVAETGVWDVNPLMKFCDRLEAFPRPAIARLNGPAIGGAVEIALACDFRVGGPNVAAMVPAARIGLHYEPAGLRRALSCIGLQATRRLYLLAERMEAAHLAQIGFLDRFSDDLDSATAEIADALTAGAPLAVDGVKRTLRELARGDLDDAAARARVAASWASADMAEGLAAMREKRPPKFSGR